MHQITRALFRERRFQRIHFGPVDFTVSTLFNNADNAERQRQFAKIFYKPRVAVWIFMGNGFTSALCLR